MIVTFLFNFGVIFASLVWLAVAAVLLFLRRVRRKGALPGPGWRKFTLGLSLFLLLIAFANILPRLLKMPAVVMTVDGVWCAPWSEALAWRDVVRVSTYNKEGSSGTSSGRYSGGPDVAALEFSHLENRHAAPSPRPWGNSAAWARPFVQLTRWSSRPFFDMFLDAEYRIEYCNVAGLGQSLNQLDRLAENLMKYHRRALDVGENPGFMAALRRCEAGGRRITTYCLENIWSQQRRCRSPDKAKYDACLDEFLARVDADIKKSKGQ